MKKKITAYLIAVVTIVNISSLATIVYLKLKQEKVRSFQGFPVNEEMRAKRFQQMKEELKLTPEQIEEFESIRNEFHSRLDSLDNEAQKIRQRMIKEIWENENESKEIDQLLSRFGDLQNETQRWVVKHLIKFKKILTAEQAEKFYSIVSERFIGMRQNSGLRNFPINQEDIK